MGVEGTWGLKMGENYLDHGSCSLQTLLSTIKESNEDHAKLPHGSHSGKVKSTHRLGPCPLMNLEK